MELSAVYPWGRSFDEYQAMFALSEDDLKKRILGCGDGPASFNAQLTKRGGNVVSIDPVYRFDAQHLQARVTEAFNEIMPRAEKSRSMFTWKQIPSIEALAALRLAVMNDFLVDYEAGKAQGRYRTDALPDLQFRNQEFDLALCSHYLFLYSEQIDLQHHLASIREMARVAREVRIYPLVCLTGEQSAHLETVMPELDQTGLACSLVPVDYEFQKGATQMLVVRAEQHAS